MWVAPKSNYDYLIKIDGISYAIDLDVKMLNLSDRDIALIIKCMESIEIPKQAPKLSKS